MNPPFFRESIQKLFESSLDADEIDRIVSGFEALDPSARQQALDVGLILSDFSVKGAAEYFRVVPEVLSSLSPEELGGWVGMGIKVAEKSSAAGIRFFKQGPAVFSKIPDRSARDRLVQKGIQLAERNYNLALEYYIQAPALLSAVATTDAAFSEWADLGFALGARDYTLGVEYFKVTPPLLPLLPIGLLPKWAEAGERLAEGSLLSALAYFRNSPEIFSKIPAQADRAKLLDLAAEIGERAPLSAAKIFSESARILPSFQALRLEGIFLDRAIEIARFDGELAAAFFLSGPKILSEMGPAAAHFPAWVEEGIALLKKDPAQAAGFFSFESRSARLAVDRLGGGVLLAAVSRTLKLYAEALSGRPVAIQPTSALRDHPPDVPTTDGRIIYLPAQVDRFPSRELNFEWYKIATAFQAGYLEFGTFSPRIHETADLIESLQAKYRRRGGFKTLASFFSLFPEPDFIRRLFEIVEGARIEFHLREEYPGLRSTLIRMREADLADRPPLMGLTPRGAVVELLTQIALAGKTKEPIPTGLQSILFEACRILGAVQSPEATVAASMKAAAHVYDFLQTDEKPPEASDKPMEAFEDRGAQVRGEDPGAGAVRPSTRGSIDPRRVEEAKKASQAQTDALLKKLAEAGVDLSTEAVASALSASVAAGEVSLEGLPDGKELDRIADRLSAGRSEKKGAAGGKRFRYDEWDCEGNDYRAAWCRVVEQAVEPGESGSVGEILSEYCGMIQSIRTAFQYLRPEGLKRIKREREGDELDLDALLASRVEARSGRPPSDRVYIQRRKKERSVAVAFLIDLSGSTERRLPKSGKSILQVEKEALILLSRAVEAVGDPFALYGFSGRGKETVDFHILKDFQERGGAAIDRRIGTIRSAIQNRDGAAIRHAVRKLSQQTAKIKLLILISDGKPLDDDYSGAYAVADTKRALQEAKRRGIHPYCVTVDREGEEYLEGMYGGVAYTVIDRIETLPARLPQIYKRLTT